MTLDMHGTGSVSAQGVVDMLMSSMKYKIRLGSKVESEQACLDLLVYPILSTSYSSYKLEVYHNIICKCVSHTNTPIFLITI